MVDILILTYNNIKTLPQVLEAIKEYTEDKYKIYILDNASSDNSFVSYLKDIKNRRIEISFSNVNYGVGGGRNRLAQMAGSEFMMFLDSDMIVSKKWDYFMKRQFDYVHAGAVTAKFSYDEELIHFNGGSVEVIDNYFILMHEMHKLLPVSDIRTFNVTTCSWVAGGAMMIHKYVLKHAQYDANYKIGFEDIDFSFQIKKAGYELYNCPYTFFIHQSSLKEDGYHKIRKDKKELLRSVALFTNKWGLNPIKSWHTDKLIFGRSISSKQEAEHIIEDINNSLNIEEVIEKYVEPNNPV